MTPTHQSVDTYIAAFPEDVQAILQKVRETITATAPTAVESISYGMPAYKLGGKPLAYFAGYKNHIGFYATPQGHTAFREELSAYKQGKGSAQFPLTQPIPYALIKRIVAFKAKASSATPAAKKSTEAK